MAPAAPMPASSHWKPVDAFASGRRTTDAAFAGWLVCATVGGSKNGRACALAGSAAAAMPAATRTERLI